MVLAGVVERVLVEEDRVVGFLVVERALPDALEERALVPEFRAEEEVPRDAMLATLTDFSPEPD